MAEGCDAEDMERVGGGRIIGDQVMCGYHGLVFNSAGRCTFMPAQKTINPSACVRAFPVVERHRLIWIWPGDPALADPALVAARNLVTVTSSRPLPCNSHPFNTHRFDPR